MQVPLPTMQTCGDAGCAVEAGLTDFITSWLVGVGDSMMKGDFLTSGLNNLMDRVPLLKWRKGKCGSQGSLGEHNNPMNNRYCYFFYIMDEKLES